MRIPRLFIGVLAAALVTGLTGLGANGSATAATTAPTKAPTKVAATPTVTADGTLTVTTATAAVGQPVSLHFTTDASSVNDKNWIAIYDDPANGPIDQTYSGHASTAYQYVTTASGDVTFATTGLTPGTKIAYFLYDDGYTWLATPVAFTVLPTDAPTTDGTLALTTTTPTVGDQLSFSYTTTGSEVDPLNWVAIYDDPSDGPIEQQFVGASTVWTRATEQSGTVTLDSSGLTPGAKTAYFLAKDGYSWLAEPISFFVAAGSGGPTDNGTLTLTSTDLVVGAPLTFHYETTTPDAPADLNWVGLYDNPADGPTDQTYHAASTVWSYVSGTSGDVTLDSSALSVGTHAAYFLYNDGYTWLAQPIMFTLTAPPPPVLPHFVTDDFSAGYVQTGSSARQPLSGLWMDPGATDTTYRKVSGDSWLHVSTSGLVTGRAPTHIAAHPALITVAATDDQGRTATTTVEFTVAAGSRPPQLTTASWNLWDAGSHVDDPLEKELRVILTEHLDVVGLQETGGSAATQLAAALGWHAYQSPGDLGLISRYPIERTTTPTPARPFVGATIRVGSGNVRVWTAHLSEDDYGPYAVCFNGIPAAAEVTAEQRTTRYQQATTLASAMAGDLTAATRSHSPVILLGDLASPSALDWTAATAASHCGAGALAWPVSTALAGAGLSDSYRVVHPDPAANPGNTWSPVLPIHPGTTTPEPQDRIDVVDFAGALTALTAASVVTGFPQAEPDTAANGWPSDHDAAVATFGLR